jgi:hypothetical protein
MAFDFADIRVGAASVHSFSSTSNVEII